MFDEILEFLYGSWRWILAISTIVTIFPVINALKNFFKNKDNNSSKWYKVLGKIVPFISFAFVVISCIVYMICTEVPDITTNNISVEDAKKILSENDLGIEFIINVNDEPASIVTWQSPKKNKIVLKGSNVTILTEEKVRTPIMVDVPSVIGKNYITAITLLTQNDLQYKVRAPEENGIPLDQYNISYQSITAGSSVPEETIIELELSLEEVEVQPIHEESSDLIPIPNLIGIEEQEAVNLLMSIGLKSNVYWLQGNDETADYYYILNQSIPEGSLVAVGTVIELERSPKQPGTPVKMPNVIGMEQIEATSLLMKNGLQFQVWWSEEENETSSDIYYIKDQSIQAGSTVTAGTIIELELTSQNPNN